MSNETETDSTALVAANENAPMKRSGELKTQRNGRVTIQGRPDGWAMQSPSAKGIDDNDDDEPKMIQPRVGRITESAPIRQLTAGEDA